MGQQTQTLLRMTMESALTAKVSHREMKQIGQSNAESPQEMPGFMYAYELRGEL